MTRESTFENHQRLNGEYLKDAAETLAKEDYLQASEKFWAASAEIMKAVAAEQKKQLRSHTDFWDFIMELDSEHKELGLFRDFAAVNQLHSNYYEEELSPEAVRRLGDVAKDFIKKMEWFL